MAMSRPPQRPDYSDLEVVTRPRPTTLMQSHGPEVHNDRDDPEVVWAEHDPTTLPYAYDWPKEDKDKSSLGSSWAVQEPVPKTICGLRRRTFWIVAGVIGFILVAGGIGGGVGAYFALRGKDAASQGENASPEPQSLYLNLSISALHWVDEEDVGQYRVYHQPAGQAQIFESAWDTDEQCVCIYMCLFYAFRGSPGSPRALLLLKH